MNSCYSVYCTYCLCKFSKLNYLISEECFVIYDLSNVSALPSVLTNIIRVACNHTNCKSNGIWDVHVLFYYVRIPDVRETSAPLQTKMLNNINK